MVDWIVWGKMDLPPEAATEHFLVVGASGSGKTILIQRLLWSLYQNTDSSLSKQNRAVIYDPKQDVVSSLYLMGQEQRVRILHPFDKRSYAWDMAADIDGPISARQAATLLIPEQPGSQKEPFFDNAVRDILTGVMLAFINCVPNEKQWTFRDVLLAMLYEPYLRYVLGQTITRKGEPFHIGTRLYSTYLDRENADSRTISNIRATINARLSIYEPIAAVWDKAQREETQTNKRTISLKEWVDSDLILVLGNDEAARGALDAVNQLLFKRLTEILLNKPEIKSKEVPTVVDWGEDFTRPLAPGEEPPEEDEPVEYSPNGEDLTWVVLDEIREAGRLDGLSRLMTKGRSKRVAVVLGFQDIDGLRAVYGNEVAHEITGQCQNIALLQVSSPSTAEWGTNLFGKFLKPVTSTSESLNEKGGVTAGEQYEEADRALLFSGNLIYLPKTNPTNGLTGYFRSSYRTPKQAAVPVHLPWETGVKPFLPIKPRRPSANNSNFVEREVEEHYLLVWTPDDWKRLGFPDEPPSLGQQSAKPTPPAPPVSGPAQSTPDTVRPEKPPDLSSPLDNVRRVRGDNISMSHFQ